jgi:midasin
MLKEDAPTDERKRDREEEPYRGHKAKKKRVGDAEQREEEEDGEQKEAEEDGERGGEEEEQMSLGEEEDSDGEQQQHQPAEGDVLQGNKIVTNEQFSASRTDPAANPAAWEAQVQLYLDPSAPLSSDTLARGRALWQRHRAATDTYATQLSEQLRLILGPTLATRLRGDYRTGKRINMRKVIPYVASGFRKDKIWLRRTKPAKRAYQVMLLIDDSLSMGAAGPLTLSSLTLLANALTRLEVGELAIAAFAEQVRVLHAFGSPFTEESGARVVSQFQFRASSTLLSQSLSAVLPVFQKARAGAQTGGGGGAVLQLCFVISDARIDSDNRAKLEATVRSLSEQNILVVLVIIDANAEAKDSIFNTRSVSFAGNKVVTKSYFDDFPFPYYVAVQRVEALPDLLSEALKQWFELVRLQATGN